jgi:hypothetical protein
MVLPFESVDPAPAPDAPADEPADVPPELCASAKEQAARLTPKAIQITFIEPSDDARPAFDTADRPGQSNGRRSRSYRRNELTIACFEITVRATILPPALNLEC